MNGLNYSEKDLNRILNSDDQDDTLINKCRYIEPEHAEAIDELTGNKYKLRYFIGTFVV